MFLAKVGTVVTPVLLSFTDFIYLFFLLQKMLKKNHYCESKMHIRWRILIFSTTKKMQELNSRRHRNDVFLLRKSV